jgi:tetratricopeptide (TPR) repeat protein
MITKNNITDKELSDKKTEFKSYLESGNPEEAMFCAKRMGYFGVAAKIAVQKKDFYNAAWYFKLFGDYNKAFDNYVKNISSDSNRNSAINMAEQLKDAGLLLKVYELQKENVGKYAKNEYYWEEIYQDDFSTKKYKEYINFEKTKSSIEDHFGEELIALEDYDSARDLFQKVNRFDKAREITQKESGVLKEKLGEYKCCVENVLYKLDKLEQIKIDLTNQENKLEKEVLEE